MLSAHSDPIGCWHTVLRLRAVVGHLNPGLSPYGQHGNLMPEREIAARAAAQERLPAAEDTFVEAVLDDLLRALGLPRA